MGIITAPTEFNENHDASSFNSGNQTLDDWLIRRALKNQQSGASRTFVVCQDNRVIGYYALASGSVERSHVSTSLAKNMPDPIPVTVLGRLAIDHQFQGQRLGAGLLRDAILRTLNVSNHIGIRAMLVHTISEEAKQFYLKHDFRESVIDPMTLLISLKNLKAHFS